MSRPDLTCVYGEPFTVDDVWDPAAVVLIVGLRGCGKTSLVLAELFESLELERVTALDPHGEYSEELLTLDEYDQFTKDWPDNADESYMATIGGLDVEDLAAHAWRLVRLLEARERNSTLVIEESGIVEVSRRAGMAFNHLASQSRHWGCPLVFIAQRAAQVPTTVRSQATVIVSFAQSAVADIEALEERFEVQDPELGGKIAKLKQHEYVVWRLWDPNPSE